MELREDIGEKIFFDEELSEKIYSAANLECLIRKFELQQENKLKSIGNERVDNDSKLFEQTNSNQTRILMAKSALGLIGVNISENKLTELIRESDEFIQQTNENKRILANRCLDLIGQVRAEFCDNYGEKKEISAEAQLNILREKKDLIREINSILFKLGVIKIPSTMEFKVNRRNPEVAENLGIRGFPELEAILVDFYESNGIKKGENNKGKLISMSWGCGNAGGLLDRRLQRDNKSIRDLSKYFEYFGCADYIYASLDDMIYYFIKKEERAENEVGFREFSYILATLILRQHRIVDFDQKNRDYTAEHSLPYEDRLGLRDEVRHPLLNIVKDANCLRDIFYYLDECNVVKKNEAKYGITSFIEDLEYPSQKATQIKTEKCKELFSELGSCFYDEFKQKRVDVEDRVKAFLDRYFKPFFQEQAHNLNTYNKVHTHNVFLMDFQEAEGVFGKHDGMEKTKFNLVTAYRSNSHQKRGNYIKTLRTLIDLLADGGIILDDGDRESYTREECFDEILEIARANPDINVDIISTKDNKKLSIFIQKGLKKPIEQSEENIFLSVDQKEQIIKEGCLIVPIEIFLNQKVVQNFRSLIVAILKEKNINGEKIDSNYFLRTNFFRTINEKINQEIMDYILQETIRYLINNLPNLVYKVLDKLPDIGDTLDKISDEDLRMKVIKELVKNDFKEEDLSYGKVTTQNLDISKMTISELMDDINCRVDKIPDLMRLQKKVSEILARLGDKEADNTKKIISEISEDIKREKDTLKSVQILGNELLPMLISKDSNLLTLNFDTLSKLVNLDLGMLKLNDSGVDLKNMTKKKKHFFKLLMNVLKKANIPINSQTITESIYNDEDKYNKIIDKVENSEAVISRINHCSVYLNRFPFLLEKN